MGKPCEVTFRVNAGPDVGLGHLRRCLTLAKELARNGCAIQFVCSGSGDREAIPHASGFAFSWLENEVVSGNDEAGGAEQMTDAESTLSAMSARDGLGSWVVVDSYALGRDWERRIRAAGYRVAAVDDFRNRMHCADLLTSDSETPFDPASNEVREGVLVLAGRHFALISREYEFAGESDSPSTPPTLLVTYGGSDPTGETLKALVALADVRGLVGRIEVVVGALSPMADAISERAREVPRVVVHRAPASLAPLMRSADLILTAGGNTMVEALALRKPCLVTVTADNQRLMVDDLVAEGMIRAVDGSHPLGAAVDDALMNLEALTARVRSKPVFDTEGPRRVAEVMLEAVRGERQ